MLPALILFIKGLFIGLVVSAPPGPNAMLMINRTLRKGHYSGFITGMGVATADTIFAVMAGLGFSYIIGFINEESFYIKIIAGVIVAAAGVKLFLANPVADIRDRFRDKIKSAPVQDYLSVFMLALTNPFSIFIALFPGMDISFTGLGVIAPAIVIMGVFTGASAWWFLLSWMVNRYSRTLRLRSVVTITRVSGAVVISIGLLVLMTLFFSHSGISSHLPWVH
jgi:threonine/homoserine/homoserine lactone efflux protein